MRPLLVLAVLLLAGCADPPASAEAGPSPTGSGSASASTAPEPMPAAVPEPVPFTWSGHTKEGAWVCTEQAGTGQCPAGQQALPDGGHVTAIAYAGNLTAIDATMTWQADPTQTGLVLAAYGNTSAGRGLLATAQGASPLTLALETTGLGLVPDNVVVLMVWPQGKTPTSPSVFVDATQQPFMVQGTLSQTT